jgi:hypothetical protein
MLVGRRLRYKVSRASPARHWAVRSRTRTVRYQRCDVNHYQPETNQPQTTTSDASGRYRFPLLQVGPYQLSLTATDLCR